MNNKIIYKGNGQIDEREGRFFMKKFLCSIFESTEIKFIEVIIIMLAMAVANIYTFDCFLPWIFFLICFDILLEDDKWTPRDCVMGSIVGGLLAVIVVGMQEKMLLVGFALIGGFLFGKIGNTLFRTWIGSSVTVKLLGVIFTALIGIGLTAEGYLFWAKNIWGGIGFVLALALIYLCLIREIKALYTGCKKVNTITMAGALLFTVFSSLGNLYVYEQNMPYAWILFIVLFIGWFLLFYIGLESFYEIICRIKLTGSERRRKSSIIITGILSFLVAMAGFIPYFLTFYPGVVVYDAWMQLMQVFGQPYSNHHPWIHTMIIKFFWETGIALFHSENRAIALYVLFSMAFLAFAIACMAGYLYSKGLKKRYLILLLLAYTLSPSNGMYAINMWKDTPHGAVCLIFTVLLAVLYDNMKAGNNKWILWVLFIPCSFFACFMRSNGLYAYVLLIPFLVYVFRKQLKCVLGAVVCVIILAVIYKGPIFNYFNVEESDITLSLSIPAQQIAAVISYNGEMTEEQEELISEIIEIDKVPEAYLGSIHCSDSVLELIREKGNQQYIIDNKVEFFKLWMELGWENKYIYLKAFVDETEGYWYYRTSYVFIWFTYIYENGNGINRDSKVPETVEANVREMLDKYETHFWKYYGSSFFIYLLLFSAYVSLKKRQGFFMYVMSIGLWATLLIATPVYADFRYIYAIFLSIPLLVILENMRAEKNKG